MRHGLLQFMERLEKIPVGEKSLIWPLISSFYLGFLEGGTYQLAFIVLQQVYWILTARGISWRIKFLTVNF
jgi:hypothetical protein